MAPKTRGKAPVKGTVKGRGQRGKKKITKAPPSSSSSSSHEEEEIAHESTPSTASDTPPSTTPVQRTYTTRRFADATMHIDDFENLELDASTQRPPVPSRPATAARVRSKRTRTPYDIAIGSSKRSRRTSPIPSPSSAMATPRVSITTTPPTSPVPQQHMSTPQTPGTGHRSVSSPQTAPFTPTASRDQQPQVITPIVPRDLRVFNPEFHRDEDHYQKFIESHGKKVFSCRSVSFRGDRAIQSLRDYFVAWIPYFEFLDRSQCFEYPVRCFYANIGSRAEVTPMKTFFVRDISVTPDLISQIIGVPNEGADIFADTIESYSSYSEGESAASASLLIHGSSDPKLITSEFFVHLAFLPRCIARILGGSIYSKAGNRDKTAGSHKLLTYLLLKKIKVNLPLLLYKTIWHGTHYGRSFFPHGTLVSSIIAQHGLALSTFPEIPRYDPFSQGNLSLMKFKAQNAPITLDTPRPQTGSKSVSHTSSAAGTSTSEPHTSAPVSTSPLVSATSSEPVPASVALSSGPSVSVPSSAPPATDTAPPSRYPSLESIIPLFSLIPGQRASLREAIPLLQSSLLGMLNENIRSHNETRDAILSALGLPLLPPRPLYTSPFETPRVSTLPVTTSVPPPPPPPPPGSDPAFITPMDLSHALESISIPTDDSDFSAVADIIEHFATPSSFGAGTTSEPFPSLPEDAPIGTLRPVLSSSLAPVYTTSDIVTTAPVDPRDSLDHAAESDSPSEEIMADQCSLAPSPQPIPPSSPPRVTTSETPSATTTQSYTTALALVFDAPVIPLPLIEIKDSDTDE